MIYDKSLFKKELTEYYFEHSISEKKRIGYSIFIALFSFSVYLILQTLERSVLIDVVPRYISKSCFGTLMVYNDIFYVFYVIYLATNYNFLTFDEIFNNKWYIPFKFGFNPIKMIFTKLFARLFSIYLVYGMGYLVMLFLTSILKYPFELEYIITIFILGLIDVSFIIIVTMTLSLYLKKGISSNYALFFGAFLIVILKYILGYFNVVNNKNNFNNKSVLSQCSEYIYILFIISAVCLVIIFIKGKINSRYYFFSFSEQDYDFSEDVTITLLSDSEFKNVTNSKLNKEVQLKLITQISNSFLILAITISILLNILVLLITITTSSKEISIFNIIPYVFQSDTMEPAIKYNDLVFFSQSEANKILNGDIVIYKANVESNIARIKFFQSDNVIVDIDNYPFQSEAGVYRETINKNQIYGKYIGRSRWLGLLVLFANSTVGRLFLLFIPIVLLFNYKQIIDLFNYIIKKNMKE